MMRNILVFIYILPTVEKDTASGGGWRELASCSIGVSSTSTIVVRIINNNKGEIRELGSN